MKAWVLKRTFNLLHEMAPLELVDVPIGEPASNEILLKVSCCGVCHTELDEIEGRTPPSQFPMIPGHQVVGHVVKKGAHADRFQLHERVGVAWIFSACGQCEFCLKGNENLCPQFQGTGRDAHGGYAEYMMVGEKFAYGIPNTISDHEAAPLLCAGAIGYRSLKLAHLQAGETLGLSGFGASGHLVLKMVLHSMPGTKILVFARSKQEQAFAKSLGASWVGDITDAPPYKIHAMIDTTPVWKNIVESMRHLKPGGRLVINAIRKENDDRHELQSLTYEDHLWMEKEIKSVANLCRQDVEEFLKLAARIPIKPEVEIYPFENANQALLDLKHKHVRGAKVLVAG